MSRNLSILPATVCGLALFGGGAFAASQHATTSTHEIKSGVPNSFTAYAAPPDPKEPPGTFSTTGVSSVTDPSALISPWGLHLRDTQEGTVDPIPRRVSNPTSLAGQLGGLSPLSQRPSPNAKSCMQSERIMRWQRRRSAHATRQRKSHLDGSEAGISLPAKPLIDEEPGRAIRTRVSQARAHVRTPVSRGISV